MSDKKVELTARETELAVLAWRAVKEPQAIQVSDPIASHSHLRWLSSASASP